MKRTNNAVWETIKKDGGTILITDGSTRGSGSGPSGWAVVRRDGKHYRTLVSGRAEDSDINTMEFTGVFEALKILSKVSKAGNLGAILTDSLYVVHCLTGVAQPERRHLDLYRGCMRLLEEHGANVTVNWASRNRTRAADKIAKQESKAAQAVQVETKL